MFERGTGECALPDCSKTASGSMFRTGHNLVILNRR